MFWKFNSILKHIHVGFEWHAGEIILTVFSFGWIIPLIGEKFSLNINLPEIFPHLCFVFVNHDPDRCQAQEILRLLFSLKTSKRLINKNTSNSSSILIEYTARIIHKLNKESIGSLYPIKESKMKERNSSWLNRAELTNTGCRSTPYISSVLATAK